VDTRQRTKANKTKQKTPNSNKDTNNSGHKTEQRQTKQNRQHRIPIKTLSCVFIGIRCCPFCFVCLCSLFCVHC
jgi:hypothetical protein